MKREDYFNIMDCASEEDITEMIQYHRSRHTPFRKEKISMTHTETNIEKEIQMKQNIHDADYDRKELVFSRNKRFATTAVAAALLVLNLGGG